MSVPSKVHDIQLVQIQPEERLAATSEELMEKIEENIEDIKKYGVKRIGLFGSYVRNEQKSESDIDILVRFERGKKTFDNYMDLKFFLEDLFNRKVDLVIIEALKPDLKQYILGSVKFFKCLTDQLIAASGRRWQP